MKGSAEYTIEVGSGQGGGGVLLTPGDPSNITDLGLEEAGVAMTPIELKASGGTSPYLFSISAGALPDGVDAVSDNVDTLQLSGTPGTAGTFDFTVSAVDAQGNAASTQFSKSVNSRGNVNANTRKRVAFL